jgi:hypothetical protein
MWICPTCGREDERINWLGEILDVTKEAVVQSVNVKTTRYKIGNADHESHWIEVPAIFKGKRLVVSIVPDAEV